MAAYLISGFFRIELFERFERLERNELAIVQLVPTPLQMNAVIHKEG